MEEESKHLVVASEPAHVAALSAYPGATILALDREIEYLLDEKGVAFISARGYRGTEQLARITCADEYVSTLFASSAWSFFAYRDIRIGPIITFILQEYLDFHLYYADLFARVAKERPERSWIVLPPSNPPPRSGGPLAGFMHRSVIDAAELIAKQYGVACTSPAPRYTLARQRVRQGVFSIQRALFGAAINLLSAVARFGTRSRAVRLLVSDYWRNIGPLMEALPDAEITLLDRAEARHIPFALMRAHRMRFKHLAADIPGRSASDAAAPYLIRWNELSPELPRAIYAGIEFTPIVRAALDVLMRDAAPDILTQIDAAYSLFSERPTAVLLRVSVSGQTHFAVLAEVAKRLRVPAIELQHGLEYLGPGSLSREHAAEHIATYGPLIDQELRSVGYAPERLVPIGSPRFDGYASVAPDRDGVLLLLGPDVYAGGGFDSYDTEDYFMSFFRAVPNGMPVAIKLRSGIREMFFRKLIERVKGEVEPRIEITRPLMEILTETRLLVSCYSTAILEALQCGLPVVLLTVGAFDRTTSGRHFALYPSGLVPIVTGDRELGEALGALAAAGAYEKRSADIRAFMQKEFLFDGNARERFAAYIRSLQDGGRTG